MSATCETCTHWKRYADVDDWDLRDIAWSVEDPISWGHCQLIGLHDTYGGKVEGGVRAYTRDGSEYRADLFTRSDFGCVEHAETPVVIDVG